MNNNVTVSIIVPVYNAQKYLNDCINSILNQTFADFELILIDDGSTDDSGEICDNFAQNDKRIKVIHKDNEGVSAARNVGLNIATGKYICFVDADDTIESILLEKLITANINNYDLVICGYKVIKNVKKEKTIEYNYGYDFTGSIKEFLYNISEYIDNCLIQTVWGKLFKSEIIKKNNLKFMTNLSLAEDILFSYSYLEKSNSVVSVRDCLYNYNKFEQNTLSSIYREYRLEVYLHLYEILNNLLNKHEVKLKNDNFYIERSICGAVVSSIRDLYITNPKFNNKTRMENIKNMITNPEVKVSFNFCKNHQLQLKLLNFFIESNNFKAMDLYFSAKEFSRDKLNLLFNALKESNN